MATSQKINIDFKAGLGKIAGQFRNLDTKDPSSWPAVPRFAVFAAVVAVLIVVLWFVWLSDTQTELHH